MSKETEVQERQVVRQLKEYSVYLEELRTHIEALDCRLAPVLYAQDCRVESDTDVVYDLCPLARELAQKNAMFYKLILKLSDINKAIEL